MCALIPVACLTEVSRELQSGGDIRQFFFMHRSALYKILSPHTCTRMASAVVASLRTQGMSVVLYWMIGLFYHPSFLSSFFSSGVWIINWETLVFNWQLQ